jgi:hypothetical protein
MFKLINFSDKTTTADPPNNETFGVELGIGGLNGIA